MIRFVELVAITIANGLLLLTIPLGARNGVLFGHRAEKYRSHSSDIGGVVRSYASLVGVGTALALGIVVTAFISRRYWLIALTIVFQSAVAAGGWINGWRKLMMFELTETSVEDPSCSATRIMRTAAVACLGFA